MFLKYPQSTEWYKSHLKLNVLTSCFCCHKISNHYIWWQFTSWI